MPARPHLALNEQLRAVLAGPDAFDRILALHGETYRHHKHRRTMRIEIDGRGYFLKIHRHPGWREILKNVLRGRVPIITARPEVAAIAHCQAIGVRTTRVAGWGVRGRNPARVESFLITDALQDMMHLDELARDWAGLRGAARVRLQRTVLRDLAGIVGLLHSTGLNHRDCYLCHFMLPKRDWTRWSPDQPLDLHVIDLHRAQLRRRTPRRWIIKDLSGLLFSSLDAGLTRRDWLRFLRIYFDRPWRTTLHRAPLLLWTIRWRAVRNYRSEHGKPPPPPAGRASSS
jgi:heptose I phosphotransferase